MMMNHAGPWGDRLSSTQGQRRIPASFAKTWWSGFPTGKHYGGQCTSSSLKVNIASVIPIIFASAVLNLALLLIQFWPAYRGWGLRSETEKRQPDPVYQHLLTCLGSSACVHLRLLRVFYTPSPSIRSAGRNLRKQGGFIPGNPSRPAYRALLAKVPQAHPPSPVPCSSACWPWCRPSSSSCVPESSGSNGIGSNFVGTSLLSAVVWPSRP